MQSDLTAVLLMIRKNGSSPPDGYFVYSRKSSEDKYRQVLSIPAQAAEMKAVAERQGLIITDLLEEEQSAKEPGRPVFNDLMDRLEAGKAKGILCWKLDRLARNPVDCGRVIWAVRQHGIRIVTPTQTYTHEDENMILMYMEFGIAHKYVDDLSRNVKRGLAAKAKLGWFPSSAPLGYRNRINESTRINDIVKDPKRFPLLRRMWELMLTGGYSPDKILAIANTEWGFRTRSGKPLARSTLYYMLTNPFYAGSFEYPLGSGQWYRGKHEPMVTEAEYDRVQALLGSKGNPRAVKRTFAYTNLIRCGHCGARVTAEEKQQLICGACRFKFVPRGKDRCPSCSTPIKTMLDGETSRKPVSLHYVYYHCTKRVDRTCPERAVRVEELEADLAEYLEALEVSEPFQQWVVAKLRRSCEEETQHVAEVRSSQEKAYAACLSRLDNLVRLKTAPENVDGSLLSDEEYARQRADLMKIKSRFEELLNQPANPVVEWTSLVGEIFNFTRGARTWLPDEDLETKRRLLAVLDDNGSNLSLTQKKLRIDAPKPFPILAETLPSIPAAKSRFEPKRNGSRNAQSTTVGGGFCAKLRELDQARTRRLNEASRESQRDDTYGDAANELVRRLAEWLSVTPEAELSKLQGRLRALLGGTNHGNHRPTSSKAHNGARS